MYLIVTEPMTQIHGQFIGYIFKGDLAEYYALRLLTPIDIKPTIYSRINGRLNLFEEIYHTLELGYSKEKSVVFLFGFPSFSWYHLLFARI